MTVPTTKTSTGIERLLTPKEAAKQMQTAADKELKNRFPNGV